MATRLRRFSTHKVTKTVAFLLAVALLTAAALFYQLALLKEFNLECVLVKDYSKSKEFNDEVLDAIFDVENSSYYGNELKDVPFYYYISNNDRIRTNTHNSDISFYTQFDHYYTLKNGSWRKGNWDNGVLIKDYSNRKITAYISFGNGYLIDKQEEWNHNRDQVITNCSIAGVLAIAGILVVIFLIIVAGKKPEDESYHLSIFDKLYTDITVVLFGFILFLLINNLNDIFYDDRYVSAIGIKINRWGIDFITDFHSLFIPSVIFFSALIAAFITALITLMLSLVRKLKAHNFVNNILVFKVFYAVFQAMNYLYKKLFYGEIQGVTLTRALYYRQLILVVPSAVLIPAAAVLFAAKSSFFLLPAALEILLVFWYAKGNSRIYSDIDNNIQVNVNELMKSEHMKIALVTNVSHDLKTPLTSIISYIDLLSKEELSEAAEDYVKVLQAKADRLKNIVTDLFDLAKSTSGDIAMEYDVIDLKKLMEQTLAEMSDQIEASGQTIRTSFPETQINIKTDGKKLYRVFQNVIDNALKYSLHGTRIFIDLAADGKQAIATIKNTAGYEMNFTEEEILQRFTRGDQARSEEGSGLGLSIAESFTKVCGGNFKIKLDGDQFKVIITFHIIEE